MANNSDGKKSGLMWLVYTALIIAGVFLLADALHIHTLTRLTVRLGVALLFSAIALISGKDKPASIIAIAIIWLAVVITLLN